LTKVRTGIVITAERFVVSANLLHRHQMETDQALMWLILLGMGGSSLIYYLSRKAIQRRRDNQAAINDGSPFCVFLRPFYVTRKLDLHPPPTSSSHGPMPIEFEEIIAAAFRDYGRVVALGRPGEVFGVGRLLSSEEDWWNKAVDLMRNAVMILCIPSMCSGTKKELNHIIDYGYLQKVQRFLLGGAAQRRLRGGSVAGPRR
jgi:hypothetical protein